MGWVCLGAAGAFARWGVGRLPAVAGVGFAGALLTVFAAGDLDALSSGAAPSSSFYRAILLEQVVCWAALFLVAHVLLSLETGRSAYD